MDEYISSAAPDVPRILWGYKFWIVAALVLGAAAGWGVSALQAESYVAEAELILTDPRAGSIFVDNPQRAANLNRYVLTQTDFIESDVVASRAADLLGGSATREEVRSSVRAQPAADRDVVTVRATRPTAAEAAAYASAVGEAYSQLVKEAEQQRASEATAELERAKVDLQLQIRDLEVQLADDPDNFALLAERDAAAAQIVSIQTRIDQIDVNAALYGSGVELFQPANEPTSPASPQPLRNMAIAGFLCMLIAALLGIWRSVRAPKADEPGDPAPVLGVPLLGSVPVLSGVGRAAPLPNAAAPRTTAAEAFQFILTSVDFALDGRDARSFVITSAAPGDGKTLVAASLAMAAAADGRNLLLVDADERERGLSRIAGTLASKGLTDFARHNGAAPHDYALRWEPVDDVEVPFLAAGHRPADTVSFFRSAGFQSVMRRLVGEFDMVFLDSPPVLAVPDTSEIAAEADAVILVVDRGASLRLLSAAADRLQRAGTPVLGYIFNRATTRQGGYGYGYGHDAEYGKRLRAYEKRIEAQPDGEGEDTGAAEEAEPVTTATEAARPAAAEPAASAAEAGAAAAPPPAAGSRLARDGDRRSAVPGSGEQGAQA